MKEKNNSKKYINVPNALSVLRLILVPFFLVAFFWGSPNYIPAFVIFVIASLTDVLDGFLARKLNQITPLGIVLDPLADKLLKMSALFAFGYFNIIPLWLVIVLFALDFAMIIVGTILFERRITIPSNIIGKTGTLIMTIGLMMCFFTDVFQHWNLWMLYLGLIIMFLSALLYVVLNFREVKIKWRERKKDSKTWRKRGVDEEKLE